MKTLEISESIYPNIRIEKNDKILLSGGRNDYQNESRHIVNHLNKGDKLKLSVSGTFNINVWDSSFYGYLIHRTDNSKENININVNNLNIEGNLDISSQLTSNTLDISGDATCDGNLIVNGLIEASDLIKYKFYGFQVSSNNSNVDINDKFPFELTNSDFCLPDNTKFSNNEYTVSVKGIYKFSYELFVSTIESDIKVSQEGNIGIMKNNIAILNSGNFVMTASNCSCISQCNIGDKINIKNTGSTVITADMSKSIFSGYLIQSML